MEIRKVKLQILKLPTLVIGEVQKKLFKVKNLDHYIAIASNSVEKMQVTSSKKL